MSQTSRKTGRFDRFINRARPAVERVQAVSILALTLLLAAALVSYDPADPSLNTTGDGLVQNWLGLPGAIIADLLMQVLGHAAWLALIPLVFVGLRRWQHGQLSRPNARLLAGAFAPVLGAFALATGQWQAFADMPFPGGALGQLIADSLDAVLGGMGFYPSPTFQTGLAMLLFTVALAVMLLASGQFIRAMQTPYYLWRTAKALPHQIRIMRDTGPMAALARLLTPLLALMGRGVGFVAARLRRSNMASHAAPAAAQGAPAVAETAPIPAPEADDGAGHQVAIEARKRGVNKGRRAAREAQPSLGLEKATGFELPPLRLLTEMAAARPDSSLSKDALEANARLLETVLQDFGVRGTIGKVRPGPVVTLYELEPAAGVRSSRVVGLADDIARSMSAVSCRVAPVPGANVIGIELPNNRRELVSLRELLGSQDFESGKSRLTMALGKDIGGAAVMADLAKMPHLLVAGTTGSGKSVGINTMILSLLYRLTPDQCRLILVDPKMLELSVYDGIPHLLAPVVTEPKKAVVALKWVVQEMENRYRKMAKIGVRNIEGFNERMGEAQRKGETLSRRVQTGFDPETGEAIFEEEHIEPEVLPFIVVVIDEMADLMMVAGKDIEAAVQRLAQMARAAGVHLITATQRPSVDVITGTIKANFPSRISFQVTSKIDSRTVLGEQGGEQLLGQGDMLFMSGGGRIQRVHGPFVSDEDVEKVVSFLKAQGQPEYVEEVTQEAEELTPDMMAEGEGESLYDQAVAIVTRDGRASTSYVQRRLQIGYNRAARLIEQMEEQGVISAPNHAGKREILAGKH